MVSAGAGAGAGAAAGAGAGAAINTATKPKRTSLDVKQRAAVVAELCHQELGAPSHRGTLVLFFCSVPWLTCQHIILPTVAKQL